MHLHTHFKCQLIHEHLRMSKFQIKNLNFLSKYLSLGFSLYFLNLAYQFKHHFFVVYYQKYSIVVTLVNLYFHYNS
jgi:hypothetical protein